jgi:hypothetical protein
VRIHENIINGYEKSVKPPLPTLWSYMIQAPWNTMRIWPMKALEYHQSYESHESTSEYFENLWTRPWATWPNTMNVQKIDVRVFTTLSPFLFLV